MDDKSSAAAPKSAWDEAAAEGIDMSLISESLRKTPLERIQENDRALKLAMTLRQAMLRRGGRTGTDSEPLN